MATVFVPIQPRILFKFDPLSSLNGTEFPTLSQAPGIIVNQEACDYYIYKSGVRNSLF